MWYCHSSESCGLWHDPASGGGCAAGFGAANVANTGPRCYGGLAQGSSWYPHAGWTRGTKAIGNLAGGRWASPYNGAISSWNNTLSSFDPFTQVGSGSPAVVHIAEAGSSDEALLDRLKVNWEGRQVQGKCTALSAGRYLRDLAMTRMAMPVYSAVGLLCRKSARMRLTTSRIT